MRKLQASDNVVYITLQAPKISRIFQNFPEKFQKVSDILFFRKSYNPNYGIEIFIGRANSAADDPLRKHKSNGAVRTELCADQERAFLYNLAFPIRVLTKSPRVWMRR